VLGDSGCDFFFPAGPVGGLLASDFWRLREKKGRDAAGTHRIGDEVRCVQKLGSARNHGRVRGARPADARPAREEGRARFVFPEAFRARRETRRWRRLTNSPFPDSRRTAAWEGPRW